MKTILQTPKEWKGIPIINKTKQGYLLAEDGDGINISGRMRNQRGNVQKNKSQTIKTSIDVGVLLKEKMYKDDNRIIVLGNYKPSGHSYGKVIDINGITSTIMENHGAVQAIFFGGGDKTIWKKI